MPNTDIPAVEVNHERRFVRRHGKEVIFDRDFEWKTFLKLFEAARHNQSCTVARLTEGMSALMFFSALTWLKASLEPLHLTVVQIEGRCIRFQLLEIADEVLTLEK